jgi:hypothetical protein
MADHWLLDPSALLVLRDCELEVALSETRADLAAGRFVAESVDAHLERIETMAAGEEENETT